MTDTVYIVTTTSAADLSCVQVSAFRDRDKALARLREEQEEFKKLLREEDCLFAEVHDVEIE